MKTDLNEYVDFNAATEIRKVASRFEMCPSGVGVTLVHLFFDSSR